MKYIPAMNHERIAILRSPHPIQLQPETRICAKKNVKRDMAHKSALISGLSNPRVMDSEKMK